MVIGACWVVTMRFSTRMTRVETLLEVVIKFLPLSTDERKSLPDRTRKR